MNTMVSAASLATAAAVATPPIASAAPILGDVSFPDVVARFVQIRERVRVQRATDQAWSEKIDKLLFDATGVTDEERRALEQSDPRRIIIDEIHSRLMDEFPYPGPVDDYGACIAWNQINDELWPVSEAMLDRPAVSIADLAWQAEALTTADTELLSPGNQDSWPGEHMLRKLFENIRNLSGPLSIPSIVPAAAAAAAAETIDPIFAAIEAHKRAAQFHSRCVHEHNALEAKLPREKCKSLYAWEIVETDDPQWISTLCAMDTSADAMHEVARAILEVNPTTPAGAAALLNYIADGGDEDWMFPDCASGDDNDDDGDGFRLAVMRHVGQAFLAMVPSAAA